MEDKRSAATRMALGLGTSLILHALASLVLLTAWNIVLESEAVGPITREPLPLEIVDRPPLPPSPAVVSEPPAARPSLPPPPRQPHRRRAVRTAEQPPAPTQANASEGTSGSRTASPDPVSATSAGPTAARGTSEKGHADPRGVPSDPFVKKRRAYALIVRESIQDSGRYPPVARRRHLEGQAVLGIRVDENGRVARVRLVQSSLHGVLDQTALSWARALRPLPPPPGGALEVIVPVDFNLRH